MTNKSINEFYCEINEQVALAKDNVSHGWNDEDFFTSVMLEYLEDIGEVENVVICPYRALGIQLNAYSISEDNEQIDIIVSINNDSESLTSVSRSEIDAALKRATNLFRKSTKDMYQSFEKDNDIYEFAISLHKQKHTIKSVRFIALVNGLVKPIQLKTIEIEGIEASFSIWDIERLYRCMISGKMRETIEIDFETEYGITIPCIENASSDLYNVYLAIINGELLAQIYENHGPRLLERNVRSFLQVKGAVNKGIRDTLKDEPDMFLAYNNGISVTAESVEIIRDDNGKPSIKKIRDMQIVNGGQTTASIYNAIKDKKIGADLTKVFIQMKLSVINSAEDMDEIVPKISAYANTQNKIQMADFSANHAFHRKIEDLSRAIWAPAQNGQKPRNWFYERARGQYSDMLSGESTALRKKQFKEIHPIFTKTDLAKYENTWDQLPFQVSEGAQKNFKKFMVRLSERSNFLPDQRYYERLVAKAILFRAAEKLIHSQQYGGYRANIVTYSLAFISHKTGQRIDLESIWKEQKLSPTVEKEIITVSKFVQHSIVNPPSGANVGEWCKKAKCWDVIKEYPYEISDELKGELISHESAQNVISSSTTAIGEMNVASENEIEIINRVCSISADTWFALSRWSKDTGNFEAWQRSLLFSIGTLLKRGKKPSFKQANQAIKVHDEADLKGFAQI